MKVVLDLDKSFNNYHWSDKTELNDYIKYMLSVINDLYTRLENIDDDTITDNDIDRLYDMFDMFTNYTIIDKQ